MARGRAQAPAADEVRQPIDIIWRRMSRPFNLVHAVPALTGIAARDVADLVTLHLAVSDEAGRLLAGAPGILRNLRASTSMAVARCVGHVPGPVMWAETLTARANGLGAEDVFVCGVPHRDPDIAENQVLVAALVQLTRAHAALDSEAARWFSDDAIAQIRTNAASARALLRHRLLADVRRVRISNRMLHRVHQSRRHGQYAPALAMVERRSEPLRGTELFALCDPRSRAQHRALVLVMQALQQHGLAVPQFRVARSELVAGKLRYRNWRNATVSGNHGILIDTVLVDAPPDASPEARAATLAELEHHAGRRPFCLVATPQEAQIAVDLALRASGSVLQRA